MKTMALILAVILVMPLTAFAEPATTNCEKDHPATVVVPKKKVVKKKEEKKAPPVAFVAPPEKEIVEKEVIREVVKEVPVIIEKEVVKEVPVIVQVPVPVAAPIQVTPSPRKRPQHVDASHPLDTDGLASPPLNPQGSLINQALTGAAVTGAIVYGMSR